MKATKDLDFIFSTMRKTISDLQEDIVNMNYLQTIDNNSFEKYDEERQDFLIYLSDKITQCIVIRLYGLLDEPSDNNVVSFKKMLNLINQSAVSNTSDEKITINQKLIYWKDFYTSLSNMPERKSLATTRDKMMAHLDYKYIKSQKFEQLKLSYRDLEEIFMRVISLFNDIIDEYGYEPLPMMHFNYQGTLSQKVIRKLFEDNTK